MVDLEGITLSEISLTEKDKNHMTCTWNLKNKEQNKQTKSGNRLLKTENKLSEGKWGDEQTQRKEVGDRGFQVWKE